LQSNFFQNPTSKFGKKGGRSIMGQKLRFMGKIIILVWALNIYSKGIFVSRFLSLKKESVKRCIG